MRAHRHGEHSSLPIMLAWYSKHECNVYGFFFSLYSAFKANLWLPSMSARSSRAGVLFCSCEGRAWCGQRVLDVPAWDLSALGLPTESPREVVHEVHEVTFMLPQKPKSHNMNTSHESLPLPGPKACKALGLIVLPSPCPKPPCHEVPPLHP